MKNHWFCYWEPPSYIGVGEKGFSNFFGFANTIFICTEMAWAGGISFIAIKTGSVG
jgi:hypothetical protein